MPDIFPNISAGRRLNSDEFGARFDVLWDSLIERFVKVECQQLYDEGPASAYHDFLKKDYDAFVGKIVTQRREDAPFFQRAQARGASFLRIHAIVLPPSEYIKFEAYSYVISELLGEQITILSLQEAERIAGGPLRDFQVFDRRTLIVQDFLDGVFVGATESDDPVDMDRANHLIREFEDCAVGFRNLVALDQALETRLREAYQSDYVPNRKLV